MLRPLAVSFCIVFVLAALAVPAAPVATGSPTAPGVSSASALSSAVGVADGGARDLPDLPAAPSTASWFDGMTQYSTVVNCASMIQGFPYYEKGIGTYVGSAADPEAGQPRPGTLYYLHIVLAGLGNPCFGTRAYVDFNLPANTSLAISPGVKLQCWRLPASGGGWIDFTNTADCPQTLPAATLNNGARVIPSTDYANGQTWPLAQGAMLEFRIPVISSQPMLSENFRANVWALDGNSSPWLRPQASVFVFDTSGSGAPRFVFDSPSYITLTATTAYNYGYLYFYGVNSGGNVYAQLYDAGQTTLLLDYALGAIPTSGYAFTAWVYWINLQPNTTYSWRFRFERNGGGAYTSDFQTFTTLPDAQVKIGDGTPAPCTDAALGNALAGGAKRVIFDCGPLPITITVSTLRFINGGVTIDGGNKVTLSGNNTTNHFAVSNYSTLTLTNIALVNGYSNFACGSVVVQGFAKLVADEARFLNNHTTGWGGALCIQPFGSAQIYRSQLAGNSAGNLGGGAIFNDGSLTVYWSDISGNTAAGNGGGIYNEGSALMNFSALIGNVATHPISPTAGGGLYNTVNPYDSNTGYFDIAASTIGANWAKYGGGVSTNGSAMSFTAVTIAGNVADPGGIGAQLVGGGIESTNLASSVILVNTLLAGNGPGNCSVLVYAKIFSSAGHNLDDGSRCGFAGAGDLSNANPRLGSLQLNGGRTRTYGFIGNSAAVDAGDNANCGFTDQRGYSGAGGWRQVDGNGDGVAACDIGAFEFRPGLDLLGRSYLPLIRR